MAKANAAYASLWHGPQTPTRIVLHATDGNTAQSAISEFQRTGYGAQVVIDQQGNVIRVVPDEQVAWSTGGNNTGTLAIEIVGKASQSDRQWQGNPAQMQAVANQVRQWSQQYGIPMSLSTVHGVSTHAMNSRLYPASQGHSDPGPGFPLTQVMELAGAKDWTPQMTADALAPPDKPMPYPDATTTSTPQQGLALTQGQTAFVDQLAKDTGLPKPFVAAWAFNEENGSAAQGYQSKGFNNWLNIGMTDSGSYGTNDPMWKDPLKAADETAAWMSGQGGVPGYGHASSGIQDWFKAATSPGATPDSIISGLQNSGWASGKYPNLPSLYSKATGGTYTPNPTTGGETPAPQGGSDQATKPTQPYDPTSAILQLLKIGNSGNSGLKPQPLNVTTPFPTFNQGLPQSNFQPFGIAPLKLT